MFNKISEAIIGRVLSPHGVGGLVKVLPLTDFPERVSLLKDVELILENQRKTLTVESGSIYGRFWLIKFSDVNNRDEALSLNGSLIVIAKEKRLPLPAGAFYHDQLIGLAVYDPDHQLLGHIIDILETGGHDLFIIETVSPDQKKIMVPAVKKFVRKIDLSEGKVIVDLPEGLYDI